MAKQEFHLDFCGRGITVETGEIAKQADGAVIIRYGDINWMCIEPGKRRD